ncbi:MAG: hypothetical protein ACRDIE_00310 [Chloroflexota bacterium]
MDLLPEKARKINVYFRPIGLETSHMGPRFRPRRKPTLLRAIDAAARSAISYLEGERPSGYAEASHRMIFPRAAGFTGERDEHEGRVFHTALICDGLLQAAATGYCVNWDGIESDITWLIGMKSRDVRGGWKYFPSLPELPPDADDLGQILQVLVKSGCRRVAELCDDAIALLLGPRSRDDGSLDTWILDRGATDPAARKMLEAIETKWGGRPDHEVMANLLYGLHLYDSNRFWPRIVSGVGYLVKGQEREGCWTSSWYCGKFYGTYVCTRIVRTTEPAHDVLPKVGQFLLAARNTDGGWGEPVSNPSDTALGLLTVAQLRAGAVFDPALIQRAVEVLVGQQAGDGRWHGTKFIQMDTNRALTSESKPAIITYRSDTVTSALCLQALCAARSCLVEMESRGIHLAPG